jgi:hypothetical protein
MRIVKLFIAVALIVFGATAYSILTGPHMKDQPSIKEFQAEMPLMPAGTVPVEPVPRPAVMEETAQNPLAATAENIERGSVYYQYYCIFCHGKKGDGNGPVGQSYVPVPSDLRSDKIQAYPDGKLYNAMLDGEGHQPVLRQVVLPEHVWYLALYVRQFKASPS